MNINIVILASSIASLLLMLALLVLCVVVICAAAFTQQKRKQSKGIQLQGKVMRYNNYFWFLGADNTDHIPVDDNVAYMTVQKIHLNYNSAYETILIKEAQL